MDLLKRAIANANRIGYQVFSSSFFAWFPAVGATEKKVSCIGGTQTKGDKEISSGGFLNMPTEEITIKVKISLLPGQAIPAASSRFYAGSTANRASAIRYEVKSTKQATHLSDYVEIMGTRSI